MEQTVSKVRMKVVSKLDFPVAWERGVGFSLDGSLK